MGQTIPFNILTANTDNVNVFLRFPMIKNRFYNNFLIYMVRLS
ncbi:hypothetical protein D920_01637 [Enterococcus faecalis 13-SD-W-01]|nr:hypothetical protein D920_01637 [Enterococcus faecalis 13-SD-W-01]